MLVPEVIEEISELDKPAANSAKLTSCVIALFLPKLRNKLDGIPKVAMSCRLMPVPKLIKSLPKGILAKFTPAISALIKSLMLLYTPSRNASESLAAKIA